MVIGERYKNGNPRLGFELNGDEEDLPWKWRFRRGKFLDFAVRLEDEE